MLITSDARIAPTGSPPTTTSLSANGTFWTVGAEQSLATPIAFPFRAANVSRWKLSGANGDRGFGLNAADIHRWRLS